jgi:hypothetical protein
MSKSGEIVAAAVSEVTKRALMEYPRRAHALWRAYAKGSYDTHRDRRSGLNLHVDREVFVDLVDAECFRLLGAKSTARRRRKGVADGR